MAVSPQNQAKTLAAALMREARAAGWLQARLEVKLDGSVTIDAAMNGPESHDDFLSSDLRMGRK
ncbi:hypothetical protein [Pseudorhodobacter aquimaris]|uniref:hypothetical protein n=1 Tax=Pseudorhodobacter aquimaris TaxID=687412 RepID=UPI00067D00E5|nr:hypothetical protein [Pseudorhodobacter aquimaris]